MNLAVEALRAVFADMDSTGRAGDEWAYEWVHESWPALVPLDLRVAAGDPNAAGDPAATRCPNPRLCGHPLALHDTEGCTVTVPCDDPDFGPTMTCPCCERWTP